MGKEITRSRFQKRDFAAFETRWREETALLGEWFAQERFSAVGGVGGFELECWLVDPEGFPAPLNEQILRARKGAPLELNIPRSQPLHTFHSDVMLEAGTTSFQIHLQITPRESARLYNASLILSAPRVAACANSPYLFGHELWEETRIPLFEQSVSMCAPDAESCPPSRVTFGSGYVRTLLDCFAENLQCYPVLLPEIADEPPERLFHLRLHNGTIWRWNRPLIGFDDGAPHLRIEHRVVPAGPSLIDTVANAALYFGLAQQLAAPPQPPESLLAFERARENFYAAARAGLLVKVVWFDGATVSVRRLLLGELLPMARRGLAALGIDVGDIAHYLGVIEARVESGRNGAHWQRSYVSI